jgi:DNA-binding NtrC family response regulator
MPTVLVVEDDAALVEMFAFILSDEGYEVLTSLTLSDALASISNHRIDLIISDLVPGVYDTDSWEGVRQLRRAAPNIPMIVCTGHSQAVKLPPERERVQAYLAKPFDLDQLLELVRRFC